MSGSSNGSVIGSDTHLPSSGAGYHPADHSGSSSVYGVEHRLLNNGGSTTDNSQDGFYSPSTPGGRFSLRRPTHRVASTSGRSTGIPALSEKLNPRGNTTNGMLGPVDGTIGSTTLAESGEYGVKRNYGPSGKDLYAIAANPFSWDTKDGQPEPDDFLHDPKDEGRGSWLAGGFPIRAICNMGVLFILIAGILMLFAGYPIITAFSNKSDTTKGGFNLGGSNASGQIAAFTGMRTGLIDPDTPSSALTTTSLVDGTTMNLVFSDEFNTDGRSFYPGDDPFWEAVDLHYWGTNNYEWYDPAGVTTADGALQITLSQHEEHNLNFRGGMLQGWNKFCFTGGYLVASVRLPGAADVAGLWPAFWTLGNLGRAGYGATLEGTWPYSYDVCDLGTLQNQTFVNGTPTSDQIGGAVGFNKKHNYNSLSFLAGQRLSACTCPDDDHPGPLYANGTRRGRSAPEIDVFEAQSTGTEIEVSQSAQWAPFNDLYQIKNTTLGYEFFQKGEFNTYTGEITQQSTSGVIVADQNAVEKGGDGSFSEYGFEYEPGTDGYVRFVSGGAPSWHIYPSVNDPDPISEISRRSFPMEPMYIIFNLGISQNFGTPNWDELTWPNTMSVDWVRVYQRPGEENVGCDPVDFPTADYIERHAEAYNNANLTLWGGTADEGGYGGYWPRNSLNPNGCDAELSIYPGSPTVDKAKAVYRASSVASNWDRA